MELRRSVEDLLPKGLHLQLAMGVHTGDVTIGAGRKTFVMCTRKHHSICATLVERSRPQRNSCVQSRTRNSGRTLSIRRWPQHLQSRRPAGLKEFQTPRKKARIAGGWKRPMAASWAGARNDSGKTHDTRQTTRRRFMVDWRGRLGQIKIADGIKKLG